jgi:hypothetical protein
MAVCDDLAQIYGLHVFNAIHNGATAETACAKYCPVFENTNNEAVTASGINSYEKKSNNKVLQRSVQKQTLIF